MGVHWKDLKVWQESHQLTLRIYEVTASFPKTEIYGLVDQLKRASYSVPANIVEGQSRNTTKDYLHFLFNARGSLEETRYFLLLSKDLGLMTQETYTDLENRYSLISKMLNKLIGSLKLIQ
jgi:four helix bundle protein